MKKNTSRGIRQKTYVKKGATKCDTKKTLLPSRTEGTGAKTALDEEDRQEATRDKIATGKKKARGV